MAQQIFYPPSDLQPFLDFPPDLYSVYGAGGVGGQGPAGFPHPAFPGQLGLQSLQPYGQPQPSYAQPFPSSSAYAFPGQAFLPGQGQGGVEPGQVPPPSQDHAYQAPSPLGGDEMEDLDQLLNAALADVPQSTLEELEAAAAAAASASGQLPHSATASFEDSDTIEVGGPQDLTPLGKPSLQGLLPAQPVFPSPPGQLTTSYHSPPTAVNPGQGGEMTSLQQLDPVTLQPLSHSPCTPTTGLSSYASLASTVSPLMSTPLTTTSAAPTSLDPAGGSYFLNYGQVEPAPQLMPSPVPSFPSFYYSQGMFSTPPSAQWVPTSSAIFVSPSPDISPPQEPQTGGSQQSSPPETSPQASVPLFPNLSPAASSDEEQRCMETLARGSNGASPNLPPADPAPRQPAPSQQPKRQRASRARTGAGRRPRHEPQQTEAEVLARHQRRPIDVSPLERDPAKKPSLSYVAMVTMVLQASQTGTLTLQEIYQQVSGNFPYYRLAEKTWQNSIRHTMSFNDCFIRVRAEAERMEAKGAKDRGGFWALHPDCATMFDTGRNTQRRSHKFRLPGKPIPKRKAKPKKGSGAANATLPARPSADAHSAAFPAWAHFPFPQHNASLPGLGGLQGLPFHAYQKLEPYI